MVFGSAAAGAFPCFAAPPVPLSLLRKPQFPNMFTFGKSPEPA
jgi:hypothetical protein